ncbi:MAG: N-methyl-L-tryptophan oxidase [Planctomycetaceae bacterium]|nr:N-methyl-L-tryptophan oxidase [Planctomycetaceae bacterium]
MSRTYDVIVIGIGGIGSAALFHLARSGVRVLGIDRFPSGHDRGSSHGESRMIRKSYFEHADYVPLACRSWELWQQLEQESGRSLLQPSGVIYFGQTNGVVMTGVRHSARTHGLPIEEMTAAAATERFPQFVAPPGTSALYEEDAGVLLVEECVKTHVEMATAAGAETSLNESVVEILPTDRSVTVQTEDNCYKAASVVVTAGAWTNSLLPALNVPLKVVRKHLHWYHTDDRRLQMSAGCPAFFVEHQQGYFYGLPEIGPAGIKAGEHSGGSEVSDPLHDPRAPEPQDTERVGQFVADFLPQAACRAHQQKTCFYTMTPDEHFVVDRHPQHAHVVFTAGLSGHGFKFAPVLGQRMAQLALGADSTGRAATKELAARTAFLSCRRLIGTE